MFGLFQPFSEQGLVRHYTMNETSGTLVRDRFGINGTAMNAEDGDWVTGKIGNALEMDGANECVKVLTPLLPTGDFTYTSWVNMDDFTNIPTFFSSASTVVDNEFVFLTDNGGNLLVRVNTVLYISDLTVIASQWDFVGITRIGSIVRIFLNATSQQVSASAGDTLDFGTASLFIGCDPDIPPDGDLGNFVNGRMDECRIYNRGLSIPEMLGLASLGV